MTVAIPLTTSLAKIILRFHGVAGRLSSTIACRSLVVCRGYNEDDENFTELVWKDDQDLNFYDKDSYSDFQLWLR
jgi:hypothetical protein